MSSAEAEAKHHPMLWRILTDALGLAEGRGVHSALEGLWTKNAHQPEEHRARGEIGFTIAVISLCAKMSKADGVASHLEAEAFAQVFHIPPSEQANVRRVYDLAKQDVAGFEAYASQIARLLGEEPDVKRDVFEALLHIATIDWVFHEGEETFLRIVAERFGLTDTEYRAITALFVHNPDEPYTILGVAPDISDDALKAHYRRLVRENHPDTLRGHGVPEEFIDVATRKVAAINAAYDLIRRERGL